MIRAVIQHCMQRDKESVHILGETVTDLPTSGSGKEDVRLDNKFEDKLQRFETFLDLGVEFLGRPTDDFSVMLHR